MSQSVGERNADTQDKVKPSARAKLIEDYRKYLDKLKEEFDDNFYKKTEATCELADFDLLNTLGIGSFGLVVLCRHKSSSRYFAVKIVNKSKIIKNKQIEHTLNEKRVLQSIKFPFVVTLEFFFKDNCNLYFVMPFVAGGDLFTHLRKYTCFKERDTKFYASQVCLALEFLHHLDLIYRDLKPENIMLDLLGYVKLTDFGFCKVVRHRTWTLCGTPEYIAPEIILSKGYGKSVDWWSFGILIYEMVAGYTPFYSSEPMKIYEKITMGKFKFNMDFSSECKDLIRNLLQVDITKRYGNLKDGVMDIKDHGWFKSMDWSAIHNRKAIAPYIPKTKGPADVSNFDHFTEQDIETSAHNKYSKEFENF